MATGEQTGIDVARLNAGGVNTAMIGLPASSRIAASICPTILAV